MANKITTYFALTATGLLALTSNANAQAYYSNPTLAQRLDMYERNKKCFDGASFLWIVDHTAITSTGKERKTKRARFGLKGKDLNHYNYCGSLIFDRGQVATFANPKKFDTRQPTSPLLREWISQEEFIAAKKAFDKVPCSKTERAILSKVTDVSKICPPTKP